jgi:gas vesicle protein
MSDCSSNRMSDSRINNVGWFLAGLGLGAVAGIFYAPKSGQELRADILKSVDQGRDSLMARGRGARETVNSWIDSAKGAVDEKTEQIGAAVDREMRSVKRQKDNISAVIDAGREAIHKATADKKS